MTPSRHQGWAPLDIVNFINLSGWTGAAIRR